MKLTPEERKQREIAKWEKEQKKSKLPGYLVYFLLVICVVYVCDEVVSQIGTQMQSVVASQLFAPIVGEEFAVARMSALGLVLLLPSALAVVYKPLCDRFGRRPFLIVNTLGMGLGVIFVGIATNIPVYVLGAALVNVQKGYNFFFSVLFGICGGLGFTLSIVLFASVRERVEKADCPQSFKGFPITLIAAGLLALSFMGFSGMKLF
jgi:Na+-transporting NADH:ubiquinone oxidoreductase subunit NqrE